MGRSSIRLKDIADRTGFSTNTVSLALRESPRIPKETRDLIRAAADELNYLPNHIAKSLVSRETKTIGLVLTQVTNPALTETAQALELDLAERGYGTLFATSNTEISDEIRAVEMFRSRQVDGMLIYPASLDRLDHIRKLRRANYPVVLLTGDPLGEIDSVSVDDRLGARRATEHLIALGHKRIGMLDGSRPHRNPHKFEGYREALAAHGLELDNTLLGDPCGSASIDGYRTVAELMKLPDPPTAIFAVMDTLGFGAMKWARENGLGIPDDLAIIGFDNTEFAEFSTVPLSSIDYAAKEVSRLAVERLMNLIAAGDELPAPEATLIAPGLVVRQSTVKPA